MVSILVKNLEPLFPRGPGEIDPGVKGPYAHGEPLPLPYPTTLLGTMASSLISNRSPCKANDILKWYLDLDEMLDLDNAFVRGPYIVVKTHNNRFLMLQTNRGWIDISSLYNVLSEMARIWNMDCYKNNECWEKYISLKNKLFSKYCLENYIDERISIALRDDMKIIREHYLTTFRLIDYRELAIRFSRDLYADAYIGIDIYNREEYSDLNRSLMRISGRGRIGLLIVDKGNLLEEEIRKIMKNKWRTQISTESLVLYVASHILLKLERTNLDNKYNIYPPVEWVKKYIKKELASICGSDRLELWIDGSVSTIGLGYSLRFKERKPLYNALNPGSLIIIKSKCEIMPCDLYRVGIGELKKYGFGTVIPYAST